jgi:hypothetical protein
MSIARLAISLNRPKDGYTCEQTAILFFLTTQVSAMMYFLDCA